MTQLLGNPGPYPGGINRGARADLDAMLDVLMRLAGFPEGTTRQQLLATHDMISHAIVSTRQITSNNTKFFEASDRDLDGLGNLANNGRLQPQTIMAVNAVQIRVGQAQRDASGAVANGLDGLAQDRNVMGQIRWGSIDEAIFGTFATGTPNTYGTSDFVARNLLTGFLSAKFGERKVLEDLPLALFADGGSDRQQGTYFLDNPKGIAGAQEIKAEVDLATAVGLPAHVYAQVILHGAVLVQK